MSSAWQAETALLTEHLRYTPLALIDEIIDTINVLANRAVDGAEKGIMDANPANLGYARRAKAEKRLVAKDDHGNSIYPEAEAELRDGVHKLETLLQTNIDINFDRFEIVALRSILRVPQLLLPWFRLSHYQAIPQLPSSAKQYSAVELDRLLVTLVETKKLQRTLKATIAQNNQIITSIRSLTRPAAEGEASSGPLAFLLNGSVAEQLGIKSSLESTGALPMPGPLETNLSFAVSQLPALRALTANLRPILAQSSSATGLAPVESESAQQRRNYIETQAKRAVQRQGITIKTQSLDGLGRLVNPDELSSLEHLITALQPGDVNSSG